MTAPAAARIDCDTPGCGRSLPWTGLLDSLLGRARAWGWTYDEDTGAEICPQCIKRQRSW